MEIFRAFFNWYVLQSRIHLRQLMNVWVYNYKRVRALKLFIFSVILFSRAGSLRISFPKNTIVLYIINYAQIINSHSGHVHGFLITARDALSGIQRDLGLIRSSTAREIMRHWIQAKKNVVEEVHGHFELFYLNLTLLMHWNGV